VLGQPYRPWKALECIADESSRRELGRNFHGTSRKALNTYTHPSILLRRTPHSFDHETRTATTKSTRDRMLTTGRGSIAQIHYTGEEAAGEINKLLSAVVRTMPRDRETRADPRTGRERR
jgi:hypothetical protein